MGHFFGQSSMMTVTGRRLSFGPPNSLMVIFFSLLTTGFSLTIIVALTYKRVQRHCQKVLTLELSYVLGSLREDVNELCVTLAATFARALDALDRRLPPLMFGKERMSGVKGERLFSGA